MFCSSSEDLSTAYECSTGCKLVDDLNQVCKDKLDSENAGTSTALLPVFYSVSTCVCVFFFCVCERERGTDIKSQTPQSQTVKDENPFSECPNPPVYRIQAPLTTLHKCSIITLSLLAKGLASQERTTGYCCQRACCAVMCIDTGHAPTPGDSHD